MRSKRCAVQNQGITLNRILEYRIAVYSSFTKVLGQSTKFLGKVTASLNLYS